VITEEDSIFTTGYVQFSPLNPIPDVTFRGKAQEWCNKVTPKMRRDCIEDCMLTREDFSSSYKMENREKDLSENFVLSVDEASTLVFCPPPTPPARCPPGFQRIRGRCLPPAPIGCPPGQRRVGRRCLPFGPTPCPPGTIRRGRTCVPTKIICPPGMIRRGKGCVGPQKPCPPGHVRRGRRCFKTAPKPCPPGTIRRGRACVPIQKRPPPPPKRRRCPPGKVRRGDRCVQPARPPKPCPFGQVRKFGRCQRYTFPQADVCAPKICLIWKGKQMTSECKAIKVGGITIFSCDN